MSKYNTYAEFESSLTQSYSSIKKWIENKTEENLAEVTDNEVVRSYLRSIEDDVYIDNLSSYKPNIERAYAVKSWHNSELPWASDNREDNKTEQSDLSDQRPFSLYGNFNLSFEDMYGKKIEKYKGE